MALAHSLPRFLLAGVTFFGGLSAVSVASSAASTQTLAMGHPGRVLFPTVNSLFAERANRPLSAQRTSTFVLSSHGGLDGIEVTTGAPKVYVVFYGSQWGTESTGPSGYATFSGDLVGLAPQVQELLAGLGTNGELWSGVMTQYCDGTPTGTTVCPSGATHAGYPLGGALAGVWYDNSVPSPSAATGNQLATEAVAAAGHFGNTTSTSNRSAQYVIVSPTGTHPDGFNTTGGNFCAWHDYNGDNTLSGGAAPSNYGDIAFTNLPFITDMGASCGANYVNPGPSGALDGVTIVEGHEYAETLTDQNAGYGYYDNTTGEETGDVCAWVGTGGTGGAQNVSLATGRFAMQSTWSNANHACEISGPIEGVHSSSNDFSLSVAPTSGSVVQDSSTSVGVSTLVTSGSAQTLTLSLAGLPSGASAVFSSASLVAGTTSTLTISTTSAALPGSYPLVITGTAPSGTHSATYSLTIAAAPVTNIFSLSTSPTSGNIAPGHATSTMVSTALLGGSAQTVSLSLSGLPRGISASFSSPTISSAAGSSSLLFTAATRVKAGTYTITIYGTGTSSKASTTFTLTD